MEQLSHSTLLLSHLGHLGLMVNFGKSTLSPSQRISFLGTVLDSAQMRAVVAPERALAMRKLMASFEIGAARPLKTFQRMLGLMAAASPTLQLGLLRIWPLQCWLKPRVPSRAWRHGHLCVCNSLSPLEEPSLDRKGHGHGNGLQEKGCHDRCLQHRLWGAM